MTEFLFMTAVGWLLLSLFFQRLNTLEQIEEQFNRMNERINRLEEKNK